jgi:hypothetical protein
LGILCAAHQNSTANIVLPHPDPHRLVWNGPGAGDLSESSDAGCRLGQRRQGDLATVRNAGRVMPSFLVGTMGVT